MPLAELIVKICDTKSSESLVMVIQYLEQTLEIPLMRILDLGIAQAQRIIGNEWATGTRSIAQERRCSQKIMDALYGLRNSNNTNNPNSNPENLVLPIALVGCAESCHHEAGSMFVRLMLERSGWEVCYLGANVPFYEYCTIQSEINAKLMAIRRNTQFLILQRDGKGLSDGSKAVIKQIFSVDISVAEDVSGLTGQSDLLAKAPSKKLILEILDIVASLKAYGIADTLIPAKIEGMAFGKDVVQGNTTYHTLYISNDNDFIPNVAGPNTFLVFSFTDSDLPNFTSTLDKSGSGIRKSKVQDSRKIKQFSIDGRQPQGHKRYRSSAYIKYISNHSGSD